MCQCGFDFHNFAAAGMDVGDGCPSFGLKSGARPPMTPKGRTPSAGPVDEHGSRRRADPKKPMKIPSLHQAAAGLILASATSLAPNCAAAVVLDNTGQTPGGYDSVGGPGSASGNWLAAPFTTGSNAGGYNLQSIGVSMRFDSNETVPNGAFTLGVWSDLGGVPGSLITGGALSGTANPNPSPAANAVFTYTSANSQLSPTTTYWVVARVTGGNANYLWNYAASSTVTGPWTIDGSYAFRTYADTTWQSLNNDNPFMMTISATPVPEPAEYGVAGLGVALLVARRLRSGRK
jgi:hypothetical protein